MDPQEKDLVAVETDLDIHEVVIRQVTDEADGIKVYDLEKPDKGALPGFEAGAHIHVHLANGLVRQYSLCNPGPAPKKFVIAVNRDAQSRGGSEFIHDTWKVGDTLRISSPLNHFKLHEGAPALLLAAGIGITPLLAMAEELNAKAVDFQLYYFARSADVAAFARHFETCPYKANVHLKFGLAPEAVPLELEAILSDTGTDAHLYVCGPAGFINAALEAAETSGWDRHRLHREFFAAPEVEHTQDGAFELHLAKSGKVIQMSPGQSILEAMEAEGVDVPTSCEVGVCGTCVTRVLEGIPDHQDVYLTDEEHEKNDSFTPCCSWSKTAKLVIDV